MNVCDLISLLDFACLDKYDERICWCKDAGWSRRDASWVGREKGAHGMQRLVYPSYNYEPEKSLISFEPSLYHGRDALLVDFLL